MRSIRKLVLLAMMAIAATAAMAPSAFAQSETEPLTLAPHDLEIRSEPSGTLCPAVTPAVPPAGEFTTSGGCFVHGGGNAIHLSGHLFGIESTDSICDVEFDLRVASNATGYLVHQELAGGAACTRRPCHYPNTPNPSFEPPATRDGNHNEARPWRTYAEERLGDVKELRTLFCVEPRHTQQLEPPGSGTAARRHCNFHVPFTETPANHRYTFPLASGLGSGGIRCELEGTITTEATQTSGPGFIESGRTQLEVNHI